MKYFGMPADFKKETILRYEKLNSMYPDSKVIETYGQITVGTTYEAGRILGDIPKIDIENLKSYIEYSNLKGIGFNYTINGPCMGNKEFTQAGIEEINKFLKFLYEANVRSVTVALPSLMEIIKSSGYNFEIKASTLCSINNANKALTYKKAGADRIVLEEAINRDFDTLKRIVAAYGDKVEIIINTLCYKDCTYRTFHYNQMGHDSIEKSQKSISSFYNHLCMLKRCENVSNILKLSWVRPEDIKYYEAIGIRYYKIQGRHNVLKGDPVRVVESYFKESFDGNLIELLELFNPPNSFSIYVDNKKLDGYLGPFFETPGFCRRDCTNCGYCDSFVRICTEYEKAQETNNLATKFYNEYDEFSKIVSDAVLEGGGKKEDAHIISKIRKEKIEIDFDF